MSPITRIFLVVPLAVSLMNTGCSSNQRTAQAAQTAQTQPSASAAAGASLPVALDDDFVRTFGAHPGFRAMHPKGVVLTGTFTPSTSAASLTKAAFLARTTPVSATIRFSDGGGTPTVADTDPMSADRGMSIKLALPGGGTMDFVTLDIPRFPTATSEEFGNLVIALGKSGPKAAKPTAFDEYLTAHPNTAHYFKTLDLRPPVSFATLKFNGINAFKFTNASGTAKYGRYMIVPAAGVQYMSKEQAPGLSPNYLMDEIQSRVTRGPVKFTIFVQEAAQGDKIEDPSIPWPQSRPKVELGTLEITKNVPDSFSAQKKLLFLPSSVPDGIAPADPMIPIRTAEYGVSYSRRTASH